MEAEEKLKSAAKSGAAERCPLCGKGNDCQRCASGVDKASCWCFNVEMPKALTAKVPADLKDKACICRECVTAFHREQEKVEDATVAPGDCYFENGLAVFTEEYLRRRGYCCDSGCRHCPYDK